MNWFVEQWQQLVDAFNTIAERFQEMFVKSFKEIPANVMKGIKVETRITESDKWQAMLDVYKGLGVLDEKQSDKLLQMKDLAHPYDYFLYFAMQMKLLSGTIDTMSSSGQSFMQQSINQQQRPGLPNPFEIIRAAFIAPEKTGDVRLVMEKLGYPEELIDLFFLANYQTYDLEHIRQLFLRGVLDESKLFERMRELGFTDTRTREIIELWEIIPPVQDLLTMVAKEAFEPDIVKKIGLDAEFPEQQSSWLAKQGLTRYWQLNYWRSHWYQPSIEQGYEMLHREDIDNPGHNIIDLDTLDMLFRIQEIPPFWRDKLRKIAYMPLTRVDIRRMHKIGVLDTKGVFRAYLNIGYDEYNAELMTRFTLMYNQQKPKALTSKKILDAYEQGSFSKDEARQLLIDVKHDEGIADFLLAERDYKITEKYEKQVIKNIGDRFKLNLIDAFDARKQLNQLALPGRRVDILMDTWEIDRFEAAKLPSKTDLEKMFNGGIIDNDTWNMEMRKLGYGYVYRQWYFKLMSGKELTE